MRNADRDLTVEEIQAGWRPLDQRADEFFEVEGLLSNGRVTVAEWWGPVPEELWDATGDGSGWAWDSALILDDTTLIGWRPFHPEQNRWGQAGNLFDAPDYRPDLEPIAQPPEQG